MKIAGSWATLLRGVSQQPPEVRQPGQHSEQVNMLSDPVAGLTRRRGTIFQAELDVGAVTTSGSGGYRKVEHSTGGKEYVILMQDTEPSSDYGTPENQLAPAVVCYNRTDKAFVPVSTDAVTQAAMRDIGRNGVQAAVSVGKFLVHSVKGDKYTTSREDRWNNVNNSNAVAWVRGGAYDRRFSLTVEGGVSFYYDTPTAYTGGAIMTATLTAGVITAIKVNVGGIGYANGAVLTFVGDGRETLSATGTANVTNGVITSVNITSGGAGYTAVSVGVTPVTSGADISPQAIAEKLRLAGIAAGLSITRNGAHLSIANVTTNLAASDGGDGTLLRAVARSVDSVDMLPLMAVSGHVVRVVAGPNDVFYVEAHSKGAGLAEAVWRETAGIVQSATSLRLMVIEAGTLRLGRSTTIAAAGAPQFIASLAGDHDSNPAPAWLRGFPVTYLGMFQDRLVVGAGAAVSVSAAGDYFNFFRSSVVTVPLKDPFEMIAQGGEDDTLRYSVSYNRNLVIFGDKRQYLISGNTALTPTSANLSIMTTYADAATVPPIAAGGQIYYARNREGNVALHQIQPGAFVDSAESFPASAQIGDYIKAPVGQMEVVPGAPSLLLVRSRETPNGLATFSYLDTQEGRKQDAWSRWEFAPECGNLLAAQSTPDGVLLFWLRQAGATCHVVGDLLPLATELGNLPYLDSARPVADAPAPTDGWVVALGNETDRFLLGVPFEDAAVLMDEYPSEYPAAWVGLPFDSYVELTNPILRDGNGQAVLDGRLVISRLTLNLSDSAGCTATITNGSAVTSHTFNARVMGSPLNSVGVVPVASGAHTVPVGREARAFTVQLAARKWFPFTLVGVGWTGQSFNRTARA